MKQNNKRIDSLFKSTKLQLPTFSFDGAEDIIFPFEVKTGFVNATEKGFVFNNKVKNYGRFERIFTGFEAINAIWEDSTKTYTEGEPKRLKKLYKPGKAFLFHFDSEEFADDFSDLGEDGSYLKESVVVKATYFSKNKLSQEDILKLYTIPKRYNRTWFYIKDVEEFYDQENGEFIYSKIIFRSLNDKLAKTGVAIDQYVQTSAPGEGFAWPVLTDWLNVFDRKNFGKEEKVFGNISEIPSTLKVAGNKFLILNFKDSGKTIIEFLNDTDYKVLKNENGYILDEEKLETTPITRMQIEIYGPGMLSSLYAFGRPISPEDNSNHGSIHKPRLLIPYKFNGPDTVQRDITKPLSMNTSWYWVPRSRMEIESFYDDWTKKIKGDWNPEITKKWLGYLRILANDYVSPKPALGWRIFTDIMSLGTTEIIYNCANDIEVPNSGFWEVKGVQTLPKLLSSGYFAHKSAPRLPLNYTESIPWTLKNIPLVGGMLNKMTLGLPLGWKDQKDTGGRNYNVTGLISSGLLEFYKNTFIGTKTEVLNSDLLGSKRQDYTAIPFDALSGKSQPSAISPGEFATILNFDLTDRFFEDSIDRNTYPDNPEDKPDYPTQDLESSGAIRETVNLGFDNGSKWKQESVPAVKSDNTDGYAIDSFGFHFLGQADYKVSFFDKDGNVVFTGTYKTLSKMTDSIRDWNNNIKTSHWENEVVVDARTPLPPTQISLPSDVNGVLNQMNNGVLKPIPLLTTDPDDPTKVVVVRDSFGNIIYQAYPNGEIKYKLTPVIAELGHEDIVETNKELYIPPSFTKTYITVHNQKNVYPISYDHLFHASTTKVDENIQLDLNQFINKATAKHYSDLGLPIFTLNVEVTHELTALNFDKTKVGWDPNQEINANLRLKTNPAVSAATQTQTITINGTVDSEGNLNFADFPNILNGSSNVNFNSNSRSTVSSKNYNSSNGTINQNWNFKIKNGTFFLHDDWKRNNGTGGFPQEAKWIIKIPQIIFKKP